MVNGRGQSRTRFLILGVGIALWLTAFEGRALEPRMIFGTGPLRHPQMAWDARGREGALQEPAIGITGREIVERLTRLGEGQKRLEQRIGDVETRLEQRMEEVREFLLWGFGVTFAGIFALVGFVIWDRRTALVPAVRRIEELQERERRLEAALREYAAKDPELADALKRAGLM
jgi:hypothetical protein